MTISLTKGENINLQKESDAKKFSIGLGWDAGDNFDLDASVLLLNDNGKATKEGRVVYFKNLKSDCGSVVHSGDNRTGAGDGDDETITVDLTAVPEDVKKVKVIVDIYDAVNRNQHFGKVQNAFARVYETDTKTEVCKFDLTEDYTGSTSVYVADLYNHNGEWKFKAIGEGSKNKLGDYISEAGL